MLMCHYEIF